jgi:hypothetical protein
MEEGDLVFYKEFVNCDEIKYKDITEMNLRQLGIYKKELLKLSDPNTLTKEQKVKKNKLKKVIWEEYDATCLTPNYALANLHKNKRNWEMNHFYKECQKQNLLFLENSKHLILEIEKLEEELRNKSIYDHKKYLNEKIKCKCGMMTYRTNTTRHKKCQFHVAYEAKIEEQAEANRKKKGLKNLQVKNKLEDDGLPVYKKDEKGFTIMPKSKEMEDFYATFLT